MKRNLYAFSLFWISFALIACGSETKPANTKQKNKQTALEDTIEIVKSEFVSFPDSLKGIRFEVDDVEKNDSLLQTFPIKDVVSSFIGKNITFHSRMDDTSFQLVPLGGNGLITSINIAYGQHRPLVLSPDIIWMTIAQGISTHINHDFKNLEQKLFKKNKPKTIKVRNDSLDFGPQHWEKLIADLSDQTKRYTKEDMFSIMAPKFSTTTQEIHTAYKANILYGFKKAFTYIGEGGCGIPYITLTGTKEDWIQIKENLNKLDDLGLGYWRVELEPILDEFIAVYDNKSNVLFWKNIYKEFMDYGEFAISGWIIKFFPYIEILGDNVESDKEGMSKIEYKYVRNEYLEGDKYLYSKLNREDFPNYKSEAPILWINHFKNERTNMFLYSGIMGMKQYPDGSLMPYVTWAICSEKEDDAKRVWSGHKRIEHLDIEWMPSIVPKRFLSSEALYPIEKEIDHQNSILKFQEQLNSNFRFDKDMESDSLQIYILANGKPIVFCENQKLAHQIQDWINQKGIKWIPAYAKLGDMRLLMEPKDPEKMIPVNSELKVMIIKE